MFYHHNYYLVEKLNKITLLIWFYIVSFHFFSINRMIPKKLVCFLVMNYVSMVFLTLRIPNPTPPEIEGYAKPAGPPTKEGTFETNLNSIGAELLK